MIVLLKGRTSVYQQVVIRCPAGTLWKHQDFLYLSSRLPTEDVKTLFVVMWFLVEVTFNCDRESNNERVKWKQVLKALNKTTQIPDPVINNAACWKLSLCVSVRVCFLMYNMAR